MDITQTITHLSLCSGYEGIGLGLRRVLPNLREIAYVEREGFPCANLVAKMEAEYLDAAPVFTDVKTFPYTRFRHKVDILSGGFPCQPFSSAGKRKATEDPRHLFPFIANGIRDCKPRIVFLENVEGIISAKTADGESVLKYVLGELEGLGYRATAGIFSASEVGAPHQRKRVFILGISSHERCEQNPSLRSEQQASWTNEVSRESRGELGNSDSRRCSPSEQPRSSPEEIGRRQGDIEPTSGSQELGNSKHDGCIAGQKSRETGGSQEERRLQEPQGGSDELADSEDIGCRGRENRDRDDRARLQEQEAQEQSNLRGEAPGCSRDSRGELADSQSEGLEGHSGVRSEQDWRCQPAEESLWPARPSEQQHEWEEPRVVADTKSQQGTPNNHGREQGATCESEEGEPRGGHSRTLRQGDRETQPGLGRATNGSSSRVDRLRLLGNGVVPATAAKAFVTLLQRLV